MSIRFDPSQRHDFEYDGTVITRYCGEGGDLVIPAGVTDLFFEVFSANSQLTGVQIPGSMSAVTAFVFEGCKNLHRVTLAEGVREISCAAFRDCAALTVLDLPRSLTKLDKFAFAGCSALTAIRFGGSPAEWARVQKCEGWDADTGNYTLICKET